MLMARIVAGTCDRYDPHDLRSFFERAFREVGFTFERSRVLLKPNLLAGKAPDKAVNTHPQLIKVLAGMFLERSCEVYVGDSPGYESTERALKGSGIMEVIRELKLKVAPFDRRLLKRSHGISPYRDFLVGEDPADFDIVVNLPKFKTHAMMGLTLGVKNVFGFVPRFEKAKWHLRAGRDARLFAAILIDIYNIVKPSITILDGILGMDGDGPSSGRPRELGIVAVSQDALALDAFVEGLLRLSARLPLTDLALEKGLVEQADVVDLGVPEIRDFIMPGTMDVGWNLPSVVRNLMKRVFVKKPKCAHDLCRKCGICAEVCPAHAVTSDEEFPTFDYKACIRCYCCQEMCPEGAIRV